MIFEKRINIERRDVRLGLEDVCELMDDMAVGGDVLCVFVLPWFVGG